MTLRAFGLSLLAAAIAMAQEPTSNQNPSTKIQPAQTQAADENPAMQVTASTGPLNLNDALRLADQYNPQLKVAQAQGDAAAAVVTTARQYLNPRFDFYTGHQRALLPSSVTGLMQHYGGTQPIELPTVRRTRIDAARIGQESSRFAIDDVRLAIRGAVKQNFYEVLRQKRDVAIAEENLRLVEDLRRRVQVQVDVGEAARLEITRADAEVATARTILKSAQLSVINAIAALRAVLNAPSSTPIDPQGVIDPAIQLPALEQMRKDVLSRQPAVQQARTEVRRARAIIASEQALRLPEPALYGEYERQPDLDFFRLGFTVTLPAWNRRKGEIAQAQAALSASVSAATGRERETIAALDRAYGQYEIANQQVNSYQSGVLQSAEAAVQAAEAAYRFGERGIIEVLDAQRVLRSVRLDYSNAQFDRQAARIELEQLRALDLGGNTP